MIPERIEMSVLEWADRGERLQVKGRVCHKITKTERQGLARSSCDIQGNLKELSILFFVLVLRSRRFYLSVVCPGGSYKMLRDTVRVSGVYCEQGTSIGQGNQGGLPDSGGPVLEPEHISTPCLAG